MCPILSGVSRISNLNRLIDLDYKAIEIRNTPLKSSKRTCTAQKKVRVRVHFACQVSYILFTRSIQTKNSEIKYLRI